MLTGRMHGEARRRQGGKPWKNSLRPALVNV